MRRLVILATLLAPIAPAATALEAPDAVVRELYAADAPSIKGTGQGVMGKGAARPRFLSRALLQAFDADERAAAARKEPPTIEGDPFTDSQESGLKDLKISLLSASADKASVLADFDRGDGAREQLTYALVLEKSRWRVDDIAYARADGSKDQLRGLLHGK